MDKLSTSSEQQRLKEARERSLGMCFGKRYDVRALEEAITLWENSANMRFSVLKFLQMCEDRAVQGTRLNPKTLEDVKTFLELLHQDITETSFGPISVQARIIKIIFLEHLLTENESNRKPKFLHDIHSAVQKSGEPIEIDRDSFNDIFKAALKDFAARGWIEGISVQHDIDEGIGQSREELHEACEQSCSDTKPYMLHSSHREHAGHMLAGLEQALRTGTHASEQIKNQLLASALRFMLGTEIFSKDSLVAAVHADLRQKGEEIADEVIASDISSFWRVLKRKNKWIEPAILQK